MNPADVRMSNEEPEADLDMLVGRRLRLRDLVHVGETWERLRIPNLPREPGTVAAIRQLAATILDPVDDLFGPIRLWVARNTPFDRIYFYGSDRPLHVSVGPQESRAIVSMLAGPAGRRVPANRNLGWLERQFG